MLSFPVIVLNFKVYREAIGEKAVKLASEAEKVAREYGVTVAVAPPLTDILRVAAEVDVPVFAQHVDPYSPGGRTGSVLAEMVKEAGAVGSLVNHSEKRMRLSDVAAALGRLKENGLLSLLCVDTVETVKAGAIMGPDMLAIEPPDLIGTCISVSKARPELVRGAVEAARVNPRVHVLCGAGISSGEDVGKAIELGTEGVLLASAYVKSPEPGKLLASMAEEALKAWEKRR